MRARQGAAVAGLDASRRGPARSLRRLRDLRRRRFDVERLVDAAQLALGRFLLAPPHGGIACRPAPAARRGGRARRCGRRSSTMISSASTTVERRCAITSVVRSARDLAQVGLDLALGVGVERRGRLVEQQDRRRLRMVRAMATRCFSPPESLRPRSPTRVS